jgi:hypothetical protein
VRAVFEGDTVTLPCSTLGAQTADDFKFILQVRPAVAGSVARNIGKAKRPFDLSKGLFKSNGGRDRD